jgi:hypothetical protein
MVEKKQVGRANCSRLIAFQGLKVNQLSIFTIRWLVSIAVKWGEEMCSRFKCFKNMATTCFDYQN